MSLYVEESGTSGAPTIIWLHGVGTSGWMWSRQVGGLADFHCLNVDLPGHGKSNQVEWASLADTADQIAAIIRARAKRGQAHVVGLSLGGMVALRLLEHHADVLDRVLISGVTVEPMPNRAWLQPQLWLTTSLFKSRRFVTMQAKARKLPPDMETAMIENLLAMSLTAYRRIFTEAVDYHIPATLATVATPTLITAGGNETGIIVQAVRAIVNLMPNAQGCLALGRGHGWNVEAPALFNALVRAWVAAEPLPARLDLISRQQHEVS